MIENALRGVVREALSEASEHGLRGQHHFYISFQTSAPGVHIPDHLRARYPDEMTIVLQYQFWGLEVDEERFAVTLSFNKRNERLEIPLAAITGFADPSVQFSLQFKTADGDETTAADEDRSSEAPLLGPNEGVGEEGNVVTLDSFRKKK